MFAPVESCKYFPTMPLLLANPLGWLLDFEFNKIRADSAALAAKITISPSTRYSCISSLCTYDTPVAFPSGPVMISRTIAFGITSRFPVLMAGITKQEDDEKSPYTLQALPHCPQKKHTPRSLFPGSFSVNTDPLPAITLTPV